MAGAVAEAGTCGFSTMDAQQCMPGNLCEDTDPGTPTTLRCRQLCDITGGTPVVDCGADTCTSTADPLSGDPTVSWGTCQPTP